MKKIAFCAVLVISICPGVACLAQEKTSPGEVGIDEKLGAKVPLDLELNDENGAKVALRQIIDKPTVLTLNYFRCAGICTPQLNNLARTLNEIDLEPGEDFNVLTVSFDERDTPRIAAKKRQNYLKLMKRPYPPAAWRFLTGKAPSTGALVKAVGFKFQKRDDTFIHPGALIILSPEGTVTRYMYGITYLPFDLEMAVREATKGLVRPTISKALRFCYSYDPEGRKYVFSVTRFAGAAILLLAGAFALLVLLRGRTRNQTKRLSP